MINKKIIFSIIGVALLSTYVFYFPNFKYFHKQINENETTAIFLKNTNTTTNQITQSPKQSDAPVKITTTTPIVVKKIDKTINNIPKPATQPIPTNKPPEPIIIVDPENPKTDNFTCLPNTNPIFTHHITDIAKINNIVIPPNFVGTDLKTHSYIETDHARVPIYAPVDMILTGGAYYKSGPYRLDFQISCEITLRLAHITEPIIKITDVFPSTPALASDSRDQPTKNQIKFKAGDLIGYTTGTNVAGNWDFGVYNSATKNKYTDNTNFNSSWVYTTAVCPYDYFTSELKSAYTNKYNIRSNDGAKPDGESFCK
ncbi:MAG: hypothetical protein A2538_05195 [Candidatus Magasanikbacteria bacterium RIFOXYD2_FULL_41_14]|uniref:Uncharacterized protein n=1 Tax=Candidatus Magasanikbacteria bacterium RIFOXYD2_FULL_41_14 TaxID=1798709 RepID=A0A1F6PBQ7_9BACT|nr:MAG: hypothetical protein A2538_05195 [Candidatus Magasanikbacteria bacterium RIFOXYD2_FULL_41_14]